MEITAQELSVLLNGTLEGDPSIRINRPARIEDGEAGSVSFIANPKYEKFAYTTNASVLVVGKDFKPEKKLNAAMIRVDDPYTCFAGLLDKFQENSSNREPEIEIPSFIHTTATVGKELYIGAFSYVDAGAVIGDKVRIFPGVYVGRNCVIGDGCVLHPGVCIYSDSQIGQSCIIHAGTVIGSDGFGFAPQRDGTFARIPQTGNVVLEDGVEIGANSCIDRATMGSTVIRKGAKLDNLVQIAHNVDVGKNTAIAAQAGISGSTKVGDNCLLGGQAGLVGHIEIADGAKVNAQSGVSKSIRTKGAAVTGSPAFDYSNAMRAQVVFRHLPQLEKRIKDLEEQIKKLTDTNQT